MVGDVIMNGRMFNAIVIEPATDARQYRKSLINALKVAVLNPSASWKDLISTTSWTSSRLPCLKRKEVPDERPRKSNTSFLRIF